jgi:hypothetical protein
MALTPILVILLAYATDKTGVKSLIKSILIIEWRRFATYLMLLRVANPFSTGSGVPVASPLPPMMSGEESQSFGSVKIDKMSLLSEIRDENSTGLLRRLMEDRVSEGGGRDRLS